MHKNCFTPDRTPSYKIPFLSHLTSRRRSNSFGIFVSSLKTIISTLFVYFLCNFPVVLGPACNPCMELCFTHAQELQCQNSHAGIWQTGLPNSSSILIVIFLDTLYNFKHNKKAWEKYHIRLQSQNRIARTKDTHHFGFLLPQHSFASPRSMRILSYASVCILPRCHYGNALYFWEWPQYLVDMFLYNLSFRDKNLAIHKPVLGLPWPSFALRLRKKLKILPKEGIADK